MFNLYAPNLLQSEILYVIFIWLPIETIFLFWLRIFAGYNKLVRIFDLHRPGRDFGQHSTLQGNKEGQTGCYLRLCTLRECLLIDRPGYIF